ncbi:protein CHROMOSOME TRANSMISSION FIDELITY 7 [Gastrolobium bilobum]|uniref:protein CHROMOSOME TRANSMISSION FIDELITY 7 n=1 Tax=Gastrolobium bilobum TaxID=150636 RepID=UPI002AAF5C00|nr:protein CHROMOSOME TRANSMISSION FIDELITY 7 [Gastrolobium bilobum]
MQSKISDFFKNPSASSAPTTLTHDDDNDELKIWENKHHHIFNTYHRRTRSNNPNVVCSSSQPETGRTVVKNKKRSYAQFHLDFGQSDFLLRDCSICGVKFTPGDEEDEKSHKEFHKRYTQGIQFRGWTSERVIPIPNPSVKQGRIVLVLETDPSAHRNKVEEVVKMMEIDLGSGWILHELCKVYMFVSVQRIIGCLIAEPIEEAFKVVSCSIAGHSDSARKKETKSYSTSLQFGNIVFQREVEKRAVSVSDSEVMDGSHGGAIFCESNAVPAICGIRAIWVTPSNRRKRIASQLLDAVRKSFCMGFVLEPTQLAFSQPTSAGKALASSYTGTGSFLVYKDTKQEGLICTLIRDNNTIEGSSGAPFVYGGAELDKALVASNNETQGVDTVLNVCKQEVKNATLVNLSAVVEDDCKMKAADGLVTKDGLEDSSAANCMLPITGWHSIYGSHGSQCQIIFASERLVFKKSP